jgi:hypothetical protein
MDKAKEKYTEIQGLFRRMSYEICVVVESYHIWRTLTFSRSIPEVGQEQAEKNAKLLSLYKEFFIPTEQSHLQVFIIGLMKFFDKNPKALSFAGLINEIENNKSILTHEVIREAEPNLDIIGSIDNNYSPIDKKTVNEINAVRKTYESLIANIKDIRDKQFAHTDMKTIKGTFVPNEIEALIEAVQQMFNKLSGKFDFSSTSFDHLRDDSIRSTQFVFKNLERGEKLRLEEIKKKWGKYE